MVTVAVVDPPSMKIWVGGYGGGQTSDGGGCGRRPRWRETQRGSVGSKNRVREAGFLAVFGPKFLHPLSIKIKSIYRRWKRDTLSLLVQNLSPQFDPEASQPLAQSSNDELSILQENGWSGWPLWGGATASATSISPNGLHQHVVRYHRIVCVYISSNLVKKRGAKCLGKVATQPASLEKKMNLTIQSFNLRFISIYTPNCLQTFNFVQFYP